MFRSPLPVAHVEMNKQQTVMGNFIKELERVPWFENLGKPNAPASKVKWIHDWDEWPGPEDPQVGDANSRQQLLYDEIVSNAQGELAFIEQAWKQIHEVVLRAGASKTPYVPDKDAWYAPNSAVWHAAWTAGLVGLCLLVNRKVPDELQEQWRWFRLGHWPCAWEGDFPDGCPVVY